MADDGEITRIREKERYLPVCIRRLQIPLFSHFHALVYFLVILLKAHRTVADLLACYAQLQRLCLVVLDKCIGNGHDNQLVRGLL